MHNLLSTGNASLPLRKQIPHPIKHISLGFYHRLFPFGQQTANKFTNNKIDVGHQHNRQNLSLVPPRAYVLQEARDDLSGKCLPDSNIEK